jgi:carboxypeptidase T
MFFHLVIAAVLGFSSVSQASAVHARRTVPLLLQAPQHRYMINLGDASPLAVRKAMRFLKMREFDIAGVNYPARKIEVIVNDNEIRFLEMNLGVRGERQAAALAPDQRYLNPDSLEKKMRALAAEFPNLSSLHEIGRTTEGRPILAIHLSRPSPTLKPTILIDGMHHAREVMTPEIAFDVAESLLRAATSHRISRNVRATAQDVLERASVWVVPMINPDGNAMVWSGANMWRKNGAKVNGQKVGVDNNRNYSFQWGSCNGSSNSTRADDYRGPSAGSEPENQAMMRLGDKIRPIGHLSYHSYSELVLYPYGCDGQYTGENAALEAFGQKLARSLPRDSGGGFYKPGTPWDILYAVDGSSNDYFFAAYGAMTYTLEVNQDFQPSYELREPTLRKHRPAWLMFMNDMLENSATVRVVNGNGSPIRAQVEFAGLDKKFGERPLITNEQGILYKVLLPGKYKVRATGEDGQSSEAEFEMSTGGKNTLEIRI